MLVFGVMAPATGFASDNTPPKAIDEKLGVPIVVYGANLSEAEKESVKKSLKVSEEPEIEEITVSGEDLVKYIKDSIQAPVCTLLQKLHAEMQEKD